MPKKKEELDPNEIGRANAEVFAKLIMLRHRIRPDAEEDFPIQDYFVKTRSELSNYYENLRTREGEILRAIDYQERPLISITNAWIFAKSGLLCEEMLQIVRPCKYLFEIKYENGLFAYLERDKSRTNKDVFDYFKLGRELWTGKKAGAKLLIENVRASSNGLYCVDRYRAEPVIELSFSGAAFIGHIEAQLDTQEALEKLKNK